MKHLAALLLLAGVTLGTGTWAADSFIGDWALTLPTGEAGWLAVRQGANRPEAGLVWAVGSERPVKDFQIKDGRLSFPHSIRRPLAPKNEPPIRSVISGSIIDGSLRLTLTPDAGAAVTFTGKRMPPLPARPDLGKVSFGEPVTLFNGRDLAGWRVTDAAKKNGWSVRDGALRNDTPKTDFGAYGDHADLRTEAEFTDFQLHIEFRLPAGTGGNSGIFLCGRHEVQVTHRDSSMQGISGPGAVFGRITPATNAGKPAGEWERYEITFVNRHVTVIHNSVRVIDNQPVTGPTGGALDSDVTRAGPLMLQGDHTSVEYRNIVLCPVMLPVR
jgi:Domain of Unknown Function (DUF1080)